MKKVKQNKVFYAAIVAVILAGTALSIGFSDSIGATIRDLKNSVVILLPPAPRDSTTGVVRPLQGTPLDVSSGIGLPSNTPTANPGASSSQPVPNFSGLITPWVSAGPNSTLQLPNDTILHGLADMRSGLINNSPSWSADPINPNLKPDGMSVTSVDPLVGGKQTIYMSVGNYGNKSTNSGFYILPIIDGVNKTAVYTSAALSLQTARTVTYAWIAPPGTHTYKFCVDTTNYIAETSEIDNCAILGAVSAANTSTYPDRSLSQIILNTKQWETPLTIYDDLKIVGNVANGSVQNSESASYGDMGINGSVYYIGTNSTGLRIKSGLDVNSTLRVQGDSTFQGNSQLWGPLQVLDQIDSLDLNISGQTNLKDLTVTGQLTVPDTAPTTKMKSLILSQNEMIGGWLDVTGAATFKGSVNVTGIGGIKATSIGRFYTLTFAEASPVVGFRAITTQCAAGDNLVSCGGSYSGIYSNAGTSISFLGSEISTASPPTCSAKGRTASIGGTDTPRIQVQAMCFSPDG